jgi:hypothetical protein
MPKLVIISVWLSGDGEEAGGVGHAVGIVHISKWGQVYFARCGAKIRNSRFNYCVMCERIQ